MKSLLSCIVLLLLLLGGCASEPAPKQEYKVVTPEWVLNPNIGGKTGAIGVAGRTYDQKESTKRKLAISRALDELTLQQGVKVQMSMSKHDVVSDDVATTHVDVQSSYEAGSTVTAHIERTWQNPLTNELYVWMVMD
jgi:ABC-type uncharacterized transport system auxiliary subunit